MAVDGVDLASVMQRPKRVPIMHSRALHDTVAAP